MPSAQPSVITRRPTGTIPPAAPRNPGIILGVGGEFPGGGAFDPEVELLHHHAFEMRDHVAWAATGGEAGDSVSITQAIR
jgi:hypothetical protein